MSSEKSCDFLMMNTWLSWRQGWEQDRLSDQLPALYLANYSQLLSGYMGNKWALQNTEMTAIVSKNMFVAQIKKPDAVSSFAYPGI